MERSKSWRHLVMVLSVAVASSTICLVDVLPEDPKVGFLHPKRCSGDIEFPYTFLAKFFKLKKNRDWSCSDIQRKLLDELQVQKVVKWTDSARKNVVLLTLHHFCKCDRFRIEKAILKIRTRDKVNFAEAKSTALKCVTRHGDSFAQVLPRHRPENHLYLY
ncbi:hypothetical protein Hamer_G027162 [Homarus americanus]|uniref:Uncharacterized protein n=1 Tax=Homarus americanus TaxID=6706 RepID=A0A8J5KPX4_HOMAM|nr:hypothetical protein Hamer_G027162 [Homarus americanus]